MRYHFDKPEIYLSLYGDRYICEHPVYNSCTLYKIEDKGLAVIQQRFDAETKSTWWSEVDPWITDGAEAHNAIMDSIVKEKCKDISIYTPGCLVSSSSLDFGEGMEPEITRTFYDAFSQRYFESTIEKVIQAEYHLNRNFMFAGVIPLNDFYEFLGLEKTELGDTVGWSSVNGDIYWIDFNHHRLTLDDGMEIYVIEMVFEPTPEWMEDI